MNEWPLHVFVPSVALCKTSGLFTHACGRKDDELGCYHGQADPAGHEWSQRMCVNAWNEVDQNTSFLAIYCYMLVHIDDHLRGFLIVILPLPIGNICCRENFVH